MAQCRVGTVADAEIFNRNQVHGSEFVAQAGHTPSASTTVRSIRNPAARAAAPRATSVGSECVSATEIAQAADHERWRVGLTGMGAGNKGIHAFKLVCEAVGNQEFERAVRHRRL